YFFEKEEELRLQAEKYAQRLTELEDHVRSLNGPHPTSPQTIIETVRAQNNSFLLLASRVSDLHNTIEKTREEFLVYWQQYFGNKQPPQFSKGTKKYMSIKDEAGKTFKEYANHFVEPTVMMHYLPPSSNMPSSSSTTTTTTPSAPFSFSTSTNPSSVFGGAPSTSSTFGSFPSTMMNSSSHPPLFGTAGPSTTGFGMNMFRK
ncbi:hypothetical protein HMI54_012794, partial [Coelomomyces lativittatus]